MQQLRLLDFHFIVKFYGSRVWAVGSLKLAVVLRFGWSASLPTKFGCSRRKASKWRKRKEKGEAGEEEKVNHN